MAQHVKALTGKSITDGALSQRRALLPMELFEQIMAAALKPKAQPAQHPGAFYHGLRLCGLDGRQFSVSNTPQIRMMIRSWSCFIRRASDMPRKPLIVEAMAIDNT